MLHYEIGRILHPDDLFAADEYWEPGFVDTAKRRLLR